MFKRLATSLWIGWILAALAAQAGAAPTLPVTQPAREARRVPDRDERPSLVFPGEEAWSLVEIQADKGVETRTFAPARPQGQIPVDLATVTILHDLWDADLERAQHQFGRQLSADCEGVRARLLKADSTGLRRRLVYWSCEKGPAPFSALQLILQGRDNLYSVELFCQGGLLSEGLQVRWMDWLWEIEPCLRKGEGEPCPPENWDRLPRRP